jgi:glycosyl transferase family 1
MTANGYSPSTRLFEAAACAPATISDPWEGLDEFFEPGKEILVAHTAREMMLSRSLARRSFIDSWSTCFDDAACVWTGRTS